VLCFCYRSLAYIHDCMVIRNVIRFEDAVIRYRRSVRLFGQIVFCLFCLPCMCCQLENRRASLGICVHSEGWIYIRGPQAFVKSPEDHSLQIPTRIYSASASHSNSPLLPPPERAASAENNIIRVCSSISSSPILLASLVFNPRPHQFELYKYDVLVLKRTSYSYWHLYC
jgi:hypothetical protein